MDRTSPIISQLTAQADNTTDEREHDEVREHIIAQRIADPHHPVPLDLRKKAGELDNKFIFFSQEHEKITSKGCLFPLKTTLRKSLGLSDQTTRRDISVFSAVAVLPLGQTFGNDVSRTCTIRSERQGASQTSPFNKVEGSATGCTAGSKLSWQQAKRMFSAGHDYPYAESFSA
eukprot:9362655-Karenia_brevis.AAC.1